MADAGQKRSELHAAQVAPLLLAVITCVPSEQQDTVMIWGKETYRDDTSLLNRMGPLQRRCRTECWDRSDTGCIADG
jgi:hypothetical protein